MILNIKDYTTFETDFLIGNKLYTYKAKFLRGGKFFESKFGYKLHDKYDTFLSKPEFILTKDELVELETFLGAALLRFKNTQQTRLFLQVESPIRCDNISEFFSRIQKELDYIKYNYEKYGEEFFRL
jgi:hypothetical protein